MFSNNMSRTVSAQISSRHHVMPTEIQGNLQRAQMNKLEEYLMTKNEPGCVDSMKSEFIRQCNVKLLVFFFS